MNVRKVSLVVLTLLAAVALVGAVSAQQNPPPQPPQQWQQGQNDPQCRNGQENQDNHCWNYGQGQQGQNDPSCRNGQGNQDNHCWNYGQGQQGQYGQGWRDPRNYWGGQPWQNGYPYRWPYTYTPPQPQYVQPTVVNSPTEADILNHVVQLVATALNLQQTDVTSEMTSMTLAQIIQAHNGDLNTITNQILAGLLDWIGGGINNNTITPARANEILDNLQSIVQRALNGQYTQNGTTVTGLLTV